MCPRTKQKVAIILDVSKAIFHWGFIPAILFLGQFFLITFFYLTIINNSCATILYYNKINPLYVNQFINLFYN